MYHEVSDIEITAGKVNLQNEGDISNKVCGIKNSVYQVAGGYTGAADHYMETHLECGTHTFSNGATTDCGMCQDVPGILKKCHENLCIDVAQPGMLIRIKSVEASLYLVGQDLTNLKVGQYCRIKSIIDRENGKDIVISCQPHADDVESSMLPDEAVESQEDYTVHLGLEAHSIDAFEIVDGYQSEYIADYLDPRYITEDYTMIDEGVYVKNVNYFGFQDHSITGKMCAPWAQFPRDMSNWSPGQKNDDGIGNGHHNFCRNPGKASPTMWCYLLDPYFDDDNNYVYKEDCQAINGVKTTTQPPTAPDPGPQQPTAEGQPTADPDEHTVLQQRYNYLM